MVATQTRPMQAPSYPQVTKATRDEIAAERKRLLQNPDVDPRPADITRAEKFVFRTTPGRYRQVIHSIPIAPDMASFNDNENKFKFHEREWKRNVADKARTSKETREEAAVRLRDELAMLVELVGDNKIVFTRIPKHLECVYSTDDETIAAYLRGLMKARVGEFAYVYEVSGHSRVIVGLGTDNEMVFPDSELGWSKARSYASEHNIEDIKVVKE